MPYDDGPDPMGLELVKNGSDEWFLFITDPILLGQQNEPASWRTVLEALVNVELMLVDSVRSTYIADSVDRVTEFEMLGGTVKSGRVLVSKFQEVSGSGDFGLPGDGDTVDWVQRKATARLKLQWVHPSLPGDNDGVYMPVAGYKRPNTFDEMDRMPVKVVSYGPNNG